MHEYFLKQNVHDPVQPADLLSTAYRPHLRPVCSALPLLTITTVMTITLVVLVAVVLLMMMMMIDFDDDDDDDDMTIE